MNGDRSWFPAAGAVAQKHLAELCECWYDQGSRNRRLIALLEQVSRKRACGLGAELLYQSERTTNRLAVAAPLDNPDGAMGRAKALTQA